MRCSVVICDDQPTFRQVLSIVVGTEPNLEVVGEAANGREAIDLVAELRPAVLLLDIAMPVMDGLEALPHLRAASPATRIVMLTAVGTDSIRERALAGGARLFIEKGTDVDEIVRQIRELCEAA